MIENTKNPHDNKIESDDPSQEFRYNQDKDAEDECHNAA